MVGMAFSEGVHEIEGGAVYILKMEHENAHVWRAKHEGRRHGDPAERLGAVPQDGQIPRPQRCLRSDAVHLWSRQRSGGRDRSVAVRVRPRGGGHRSAAAAGNGEQQIGNWRHRGRGYFGARGKPVFFQDPLSSCGKRLCPRKGGNSKGLKRNETKPESTILFQELRLRHRYLDLRHPDMQDTLRLRSRTVMAMRTFLVQNGFVDIETPTLTRRTPGGAREFVSPSHAAPGKFYSLSQSPQQFKQLLMMGGVDRYFQVARCYRDESGRSDRQPEFTQIDIELSFTDMEGVMDMAERLVVASWPKHLPRPRTPFSRMTYADVLEKYGTDKPDLRFNCEIRDVTNIFDDGNDFLSNVFSEGCVAKCIHLTPDISRVLKRKELEQIELIAKSAVSERGGPLIMSHFEAVADGFKSSLLNKCQSRTRTLLRNFLEIRPGDHGYVVIGEKTKALSAAGRIRTELARHLLDVDPKEFRFLWVVDFPLFEPSPDGSRLESTHHPFTRPREEDAHLLDSGDALAVRSDHYDLVLNGHEIAGGSMRIHDAALQERIISEFLGEDASALRHLIEALKYGCPPHGGIAFGLDRILALLANTNSIRDVIAFPKTADGRDLLFGAPADISQEEKDYYHIKINSNDEEKL